MTTTALAFPDGESPFDSIREVDDDGNEFWSARTLQPFLGYDQWRRFADAIDQAKAVITAEHGDLAAASQIAATGKITKNARGQSRTLPDFRLSRYASYLTAMRGDSRKPEIRAALVYFAHKTRQAETAQPNAELEMAMRVIALQDQVLTLTVVKDDLAIRLADLTPKAEGYDDLIAAEGLFDMATAAKILAPVTGRLGRTRFLNLLRGMRIIIQDSTLPYQHLVDRGYFAVRTDVVNGKARPATVVTAKGLRWLQAELREDRPTLARQDRTVVQLPQQVRGELG